MGVLLCEIYLNKECILFIYFEGLDLHVEFWP